VTKTLNFVNSGQKLQRKIASIQGSMDKNKQNGHKFASLSDATDMSKHLYTDMPRANIDRV
jgi:hypothetical protein